MIFSTGLRLTSFSSLSDEQSYIGSSFRSKNFDKVFGSRKKKFFFIVNMVKLCNFR